MLPAVARAQATADPDVRCMLVSNVFAEKETDPKKKQVAIIAVAYYLGRIDVRLQPAQFRTAVIAVGKEPLGKDIAQIMTNCARGLQAKQIATGEMIQGIAKTQQPAGAPAAAGKPAPAKGR